MRALEIQPCQRVCTWGPAGAQLEGLPLFVCGACGSEWVRSEGWTPIGADGIVPAEVAAEAARRGASATSDRGADVAGTAGS